MSEHEHAKISYVVVNPEEKGEKLFIDITMPMVNGFGGGRISLPWPDKGGEVKAYARERMHAKLRSNFGVDYDDALLLDQTVWSGSATHASDEHQQEDTMAKDKHTKEQDAEREKESVRMERELAKEKRAESRDDDSGKRHR